MHVCNIYYSERIFQGNVQPAKFCELFLAVVCI